MGPDTWVKGSVIRVLAGNAVHGPTQIRVRMENPTRSARNNINNVPDEAPDWLKALHSPHGWLLGSAGDSKVLDGSLRMTNPY